jgi:uncharacterized protein YcgI (DUF1989 family)
MPDSGDAARRLVRVQSSDGRTAAFDLLDPDEARALLERLRRDPNSVTALTMNNGASLSVVRPRGFQSVKLAAERFDSAKGGERLEVQADDVRLIITSHSETSAFRLFLERTGRRRFDPRDRILERR